MGGSLPAGASIPVDFRGGEALRAEALTTLQTELLAAILNHNHAGNDQASPQGVQIESGGIAPGAVGADRIDGGAVQRRHLATGAVGANEIAEHVIEANHLKKDAVVTDGIKDRNVTLEKLAQSVVDLLTAPRSGATTFGYFAYLDGDVVFPPKAGGHWWDWLLDAREPVRIHDLPVMRRREDGGWQPVESILPPSDVTRRKVGRIGRNAETVGSGAETELTRDVLADATEAQMSEREGIAMTVEPGAVGWGIGMDGATTFHPGVGGNAVFSDDDLPVKFQLRKAPSEAERVLVERIFYHYGIEPGNANMADLLKNNKIYDFLNNPQLLPVGYWLGHSQNVKSVQRAFLPKLERPYIRIKFATPYVDAGYTVSLTPEFSAGQEMGPVPVVLNRRPGSVDVAFRLGGSFTNKLNFNLTIYGELAKS